MSDLTPLQQAVIALSESFLELRKPSVGGNRNVVRPVQHGRFSAACGLRGVSLCRSLYLLRTARKGRHRTMLWPI